MPYPPRLAIRAVVIIAVLGAACDGASPTAPSPLNIFTYLVRPTDARFDDYFWQELVFDRYDHPNNIAGLRSNVLDTTSPNVYIRNDDSTGRIVVPYQHHNHMLEAIPRLATQLTGRPYRGRIESGNGDRTRRGWITVQFIHRRDDEGACGYARVGADPGQISILLGGGRAYRSCVSDSYFPVLFAHEFGHAMGFSHVADQTAIMGPGGRNRGVTFNAREQYHARLAYEVGPGKPYCGWPFQEICTRELISFFRGPAPIVID